MGGPTSGNPKGGPGRKPLPDGKKKVSLTIWIKPDLKDWLKRQPGGVGPHIERLTKKEMEGKHV